MSTPDAYSHVARPITIGSMEARNRIMMATHGPRLSQARYLRYLDERARGGVGIAGFNFGPLGLMQFPFGPGAPTAGPGGDQDGVPYHPLTQEGRAQYDALVPAIREWVRAVRNHGVRAVGQLYHPGAAQHSDSFQPVVSSSTVSDEFERHRPHPLSESEIGDLLQAYALAAKRSLATEIDALELHGAHGYLIEQFLSPLTNRRTDRWGGDFEGRIRFLIAALETVLEAVDGAVPVGVRLCGPEPEGGLSLDDLVEISRRLEAAGAGYISISGGSYSGLWRGAGQAYVASAFVDPGPNVAVSAAIKAATTLPVMVSGSIVSMAQAEEIVASGAADVACMVRALMADPAMVAKAIGPGAGEEHRPCIGGNECHYGRPLACAVNPRAGREGELEARPAQIPRRVLVAGAGPAGIECAIAAAERGHQVMLVDRAPALGGTLRPVARASGQARFGEYLDYSARRIDALPIVVAAGTEFDRKLAEHWRPDVLVVATGAAWDGGHGTPAPAAIEEAEAASDRVTVIGGRDDHLAPMITADFFAGQGRKVTLLTEMAAPGGGVEAASFYALMRRLAERGVEIRPFTAVEGAEDGALLIRHTLTDRTGRIEQPGTVVDLEGRRADAGASTRFAGLAREIHVIGDALSPRRMVHATLEGVRLGTKID